MTEARRSHRLRWGCELWKLDGEAEPLCRDSAASRPASFSRSVEPRPEKRQRVKCYLWRAMLSAWWSGWPAKAMTIWWLIVPHSVGISVYNDKIKNFCIESDYKKKMFKLNLVPSMSVQILSRWRTLSASEEALSGTSLPPLLITMAGKTTGNSRMLDHPAGVEAQESKYAQTTKKLKKVQRAWWPGGYFNWIFHQSFGWKLQE